MQITKLAIEKDHLKELAKNNPEFIKIQRKIYYSNTILKQQTIQIGCLGCTTHFINNWNIYDQTVQKTKLVLAGNVKDLFPKKKTKISEDI